MSTFKTCSKTQERPKSAFFGADQKESAIGGQHCANESYNGAVFLSGTVYYYVQCKVVLAFKCRNKPTVWLTSIPTIFRHKQLQIP